MGQGTLTIYSSSAGSGKTYKLTGIYLTALFRSRYNYRKILAVTFTNKATAEMKDRILDQLSNLANGTRSDYLHDLVRSTGKSEEWLRSEAGEILQSLINDYSRFSISTIDSFFQKVLRAFARETGLHSGFNVEIDHSVILSEAVDEMIASAAQDTKLKKWLISFVKSNLEEERDWNLKKEIIRLSEELFREKYKTLSYDERLKLENKDFLSDYINEMKEISSSFKKRLTEYGKQCQELYLEFGLSDDMFYQKGKGIPLLIKKLISGVKEPVNNYSREIMKNPPKWCTGSMSSQLEAALKAGFEDIIKEAIIFYDTNIRACKSADAILADIYTLGILSDVLLNIRQITYNENVFLLSDTGEFLYHITGNDQAPFIYEKVGNRFENFMIDEFQDTSFLQWKNFKPLIDNSMAEGFDNLVVGDVKQSIYRWRNSNWKILGVDLKKEVDNERIILKTLNTNWRSLSNIIRFNNSLFSVIPELVDDEFGTGVLPISFRELYSETVQSDPGKDSGGYVRIGFIGDDEDMRWNEKVLQLLPSIIESLQDKGYTASDIGIIVRDNKEGANVIRRIIEYSNDCDETKRRRYNYNIISNDSLLLSRSPAVNFLVAFMMVLNDPEDMISKAVMLRFYLLATGEEEAEKVTLYNESLDETSKEYFPDGYDEFMDHIRQLSLFGMTERIIGFFGLGNHASNVAYLNTFQDYVLSFTSTRSNDLQSFIEWWETTGKDKSVVFPEYHNAIRVLTIHKSKGLEFNVVILPFLSWNLDHKSFQQPVLWVTPEESPFNNLGIVPVRYKKDLSDTIFEDYYKDEKYSTYIDNINLLYVALTRARKVIYGFVPIKPRTENTIARIIKEALVSEFSFSDSSCISLREHYEDDKDIFEFGEIPVIEYEKKDILNLISSTYSVNYDMRSLKLKLHGEEYFPSESGLAYEKTDYGILMHEVFEGIITPSDIPGVIRKMVLAGKISEKDSSGFQQRITSLINNPDVADWFRPGNNVLTEAAILLSSGNTRRPDRIILGDNKTTIIDFKFGEENPNHVNQINYYCRLMHEMGYPDIEAYLWYVDKNRIVQV
jgi:ATP-dependent helicase/nuclease subunit A